MIKQNSVFLFLSFLLFTPIASAGTYHVSVNGSDSTGFGSEFFPWASITHALDNTPNNGSVIEVHPGTYNGRIRIRGYFTHGVTVRSQTPYAAKLRHTETVITAYGGSTILTSGITLEGFDIAHEGVGAGALVVHIDGNGNNSVNNITLKNNILHDSYNNDILKINNGCTNIVVSGNMFYNQTGSDEHIDLNSVSNVTVEDNIFFNDFEGSGRVNENNTSSFIVIKDSNGMEDLFMGSRDIIVRRNIFLNWQGSDGNNFLLIGEDGQGFYEAYDVLVENNLMLGNSSNVMRSAFGVKGCRDITFRNNTISGNLPSHAYAMRLNREGINLPNMNIRFYNNVWTDETGTMGAENAQSSNDFSDTPIGETNFFSLTNNLYWNGGSAIPEDIRDLVNYTNDPARLVVDPQLPPPLSITLPRWQEVQGVFADGSSSIRAAFLNLTRFALPTADSALIDAANDSFAAADDILGAVRLSPTSLGAYELEALPPEVQPVSISPIFLLLPND